MKLSTIIKTAIVALFVGVGIPASISTTEAEFVADETKSALVISGVQAYTDSPFELITNSANTATVEAYHNTNPSILTLLEFTYPDGSQAPHSNTGIWYCRLRENYVRFFIRNQGGSGNINAPTEGMIITAKAGFHILDTEELKEDISYIYHDSAWVKYVEAQSMTLNGVSEIGVGVSSTITAIPVAANAGETVTAPITWSITEGTGAAIASTTANSCTLTGTAEGTITLTATCGSVSTNKVITITRKEVTSISAVGNAVVYQYDYDMRSLNVTGVTSMMVFSDTSQESFTITKSMLSTVDVETLGVKSVKVTHMEKETTLNVEVVAAPTTLVFSNVYIKTSAWNALVIASNTALTTYTGANEIQKDVYSRMINYTDINIANYPNATINAGGPYFSGGELVLFISRGTSGNVDPTEWTKGDTIIFRKGLSILPDEYLAETVTYMHDGTNMVKVTYPASFEATITTNTIEVGSTATISIIDDESVNAPYTFSSSNEEVAVVNDEGVVSGVNAGQAVITISCNGITKTINVTIEEAAVDPEKFVITNALELYYSPVSTEAHPWKLTADFSCQYYFPGDVAAGKFTLNGDNVSGIDYSRAGKYNATVTDPTYNLTATIQVEVYELKPFILSDVNVSGFATDDDRNQSGTWNGNLMVHMDDMVDSTVNIANNVSAGLLNQAQEMANYIEYTRADGTVLKNTETQHEIGIWLVSAYMLVMLKGGYPNYYNDGDKITFKTGMPIYQWFGPQSGSNPNEDQGQLLPISYIDKDTTYIFKDDGGSVLTWEFIEADDFEVATTMKIDAGRGTSLGIALLPEGSTYADFTFTSSDSNIAYVNASGVLVGLKPGTATITITYKQIVKVVTVTVDDVVEGAVATLNIKTGSSIIANEITVELDMRYGSNVEVDIEDTDIDISAIDVSTVGTSTYNFKYTKDGKTFEGILTVVVSTQGGGGDVSSSTGGTSSSTSSSSSSSTTPADEDKENSNVGLIVGGVVGGSVLVAAAGIGFYFLRKKRVK